MGGEIVSTVVDAIKGIASGVASTVVDVFNAVCINAEGGISNLAIWGLVVGSLGVGFGIIRMFTRKVG